MKTSLKIAFLLFLVMPAVSRAQDHGDADELNVIEVELEKGKTPEAPAKAAAPKVDAAKSSGDENKVIDYSGLGRLSSFSEVSVIQRRYLPKTNRVQLFGGLTLITNNPFFNTYGAVVRASYFFTETLGVELNYFTLSTAEAKSTTELRNINGVTTASLISTKAFKGIDAVFVPIYGKMTWFNKKIIPFDLYFSTGYGLTTTQNDVETKDQGTIHLGTGQIFAVTKGQAFRWDFSWNFFSANGINGTAAYNNLVLTLGWSWFIPEAGYR